MHLTNARGGRGGRRARSFVIKYKYRASVRAPTARNASDSASRDIYNDAYINKCKSIVRLGGDGSKKSARCAPTRVRAGEAATTSPQIRVTGVYLIAYLQVCVRTCMCTYMCVTGGEYLFVLFRGRTRSSGYNTIFLIIHRLSKRSYYSSPPATPNRRALVVVQRARVAPRLRYN